MKNYLHKYLSNRSVFIGIASLFILLIFIFPLIVNIFLANNKTFIENNLSIFLKQKIKIGSIYYVFPDNVILNNIDFIDSHKNQNDIFIEKAKANFSLYTFISKRDILVTKIKLYKPKINLTAYSFSMQDIFQFFKSLVSSKDDNISLQIKKGEISFKNNIVSMDLMLKYSAKRFSSFGSIRYASLDSEDAYKEYEAAPFHYSVFAIMAEDGFIIDKIELSWQEFFLQLWGRLDKGLLRIYGFSSLDTFPKNKRAAQKLFRFRSPRFGFAGRAHLFNLDCVLHLHQNGVDIKNVSFLLNGIPAKLKGDIYFSKQPYFNLYLYSYPDYPYPSTKKVSLYIKGVIDKNKLSGAVNLDFFREIEKEIIPQKIITNFNNLFLPLVNNHKVNISSDRIEFSYYSQDSAYRLLFKDWRSSLERQGKTIKLVKCIAKIFDGFLEGRGECEIKTGNCFFDLAAKNVKTKNLESLLKYFSSVDGEVTLLLNYRNYPETNLSGKLAINQGILSNLSFLDWAAEFFSMPDIKKISFRRVDADFIVNNQVKGLNNVNLDSDDVRFGGYFNLSKENLVSGKLSLGFSQDLLNTSPKFKKLLHYLKGNFKSVNFDFQLSGILGAMNFKWLDSDFKKGLEKLLPGFMEKGLERNVEEIIESIYSQPSSVN